MRLLEIPWLDGPMGERGPQLNKCAPKGTEIRRRNKWAW